MAELEIALGVNASDAVRGTKDFGKALADVVDDLHDVTKAGDKMEDSVSSDMRTVARAADKAGKEVSSSFKEGFKDAGKEAGSSGKEAAASFGGGFDDVQDFVQETLANAFEGFGPAGAAAGIAVAAILGTVLTQLSDAQERLADTRQAAADLANTLYSNQGKLPLEDAISNVLELLSSERKASNPFESFIDQWADLGTNIDAARFAAQRADVPLSAIVRGLSGADLDDTERSIKAIKKALSDISDQANSGTEPLGKLAGQESQLKATLTALENVKGAADLASDALGSIDGAFATADYTQRVADLSTAWNDASTNAADYFTTSKDGATSFDWKTYLHDSEQAVRDADAVKKKLVGLPDDIRTEALRVYESQGAGNANRYIDSYLRNSQANKQRFIDAAKANGDAAGAAGGKALADAAEKAARVQAQGWEPTPFKVNVQVDDSALRKWTPPKVDIQGRIWVGGRQVL